MRVLLLRVPLLISLLALTLAVAQPAFAADAPAKAAEASKAEASPFAALLSEGALPTGLPPLAAPSGQAVGAAPAAASSPSPVAASNAAPILTPDKPVAAAPVPAVASAAPIAVPAASAVPPALASASATPTLAAPSASIPSPLLDGGQLAPPPSPEMLSLDPAALAAASAAASAEAERRTQEEALRGQAFDRAVQGLFPLTPAQIRSLMDRLESAQAAAVPPVGGQPEGKIAVESISLEPGVSPPEVDLAAGYITTLTFLDATGEPWPILDAGTGGPYQLSPTEPGTHVIRVTPTTRYGNGNLSVRLQDLPTPVIFRLNTQTERVHYRYDARLSKFGPRAKVPLIEGKSVAAGDATIMAVLENAPPPEAVRLPVRGLDDRTKAFRVGDRVYLRTPLQLLSPGWAASVSSGDGMTVYDIPPAPVLLLSDSGTVVRARVISSEGGDKP